MAKKKEPKQEQKEQKEIKKEPEPEHLCEVCGEKSVVREDDGHRYCQKHHEYWCKCFTHERILATHRKEKA